ncbi:MAG: ABC transporter permease [Anaerolineae bacterium]|nr:ABC transporter permease [Anaerolineae bacterium]
MTRYIVRRLLSFIPVLLAVTLATFVLVRAIPGGPFDRVGDKTLPPEVVANLEAKYQLDKPVWQQYLKFLYDILIPRFVSIAEGDPPIHPGQAIVQAKLGEGLYLLWIDLGPSFSYRTQTVNDLIVASLPISAHLGAMALALGLVIGIPAGCISALKQNTMPDYVTTFFAILGQSIPNIVMGPILIWLLALKLGWFPVARWQGPEYWVLPTITLGSGLSAGIARLTRGSLLQVIQEDYIRTARAKGLREYFVIVRHALKNSMIPVVTILGPMFAAVLTGGFTVELIFGIPGLGKHFVTCIGNRDYPVVMGTTLLYAVAIVVANLVVDVTYAWLDPRIRYD